MSCLGREEVEELQNESPELKAFLWIVDRLANCRQTEWHGIKIEPNGFITSLDSLIKYVNGSEWKVRAALKRAAILGYVKIEPLPRQLTRVVRLNITENITENITPNTTKKRIKSKSTITANITENINSSSLAVKTLFSDAVIPFSDSKKVLQKDGSERSAPSPADQKRIEKERAWVKDVLFKDCTLYQSDPKLNAFDRSGVSVALMLYRSWKSAYPAVDICSQIKEAHAWEVSNKAKRKTNRARFLNNWLSSEQDKGGVFKNGPVTHDSRPSDRRQLGPMPREIPNAVKRRDPTEAEYEADRLAILADIEARKQREARELAELPV